MNPIPMIGTPVNGAPLASAENYPVATYPAATTVLSTVPAPVGGACVPATPCANGSCVVVPPCDGSPPLKGVCDSETGQYLYYFPGQPGYNESVVGTYQGEQYFCSYNEAAAAGFEFAE
jgi:hypothetical protein